MCLNAVLGSPTVRIMEARHVVKNTIITKMIFIFRIKGLIYFFSSSLNLNKFLVKKIWANTSSRINKIIINLLVIENNIESKFKPKNVACNAKNIQENIPK